MKTLFQRLLLYAYRLVKSIGLLDLEPFRRVFEQVYFFYKRHLEAPELGLLRPYVWSGSCVIDVGANIGYFSRMAADWVSDSGTVIAIEPAPDNIERLKKMILRHRLEGRVEIVEAVAADRKGRRHLVINPDHPGDHRIGDRGEVVRAETLDDLTENRADLRVSLVKLDVQGAEQIVLEGANKLLSKDHPALMVEMSDEALKDFGSTVLGLAGFLSDYGYLPYRVESNGLTRLDKSTLSALAQGGYADVLFLTDEKANSGMNSDRGEVRQC